MSRRTSNGLDSSRQHAAGKNSGARTVGAIAQDRGGIGQVIRRAEAYIALNARLQGLIPENARGEIGIACVEDDCLVIAAASPARAAQARLLADRLLEASRANWPEKLARARVIVAPGMNLDASTR